MNVTKAAAFLLLAFLGLPALAQGTAPASHVYAGATVGQVRWSPACNTCDNLDSALRVFGGYQVNRVLAAEAGFANLGETRGSGVLVKANSWDASVVAGWPIAGALSVHGRLGMYRANLKGGGTLAGQQHDNYGLLYGLGAQFEATANLALRFDWLEYSGAGGSGIPDSDIRLLSLGALWRFR
ncbi:MAG TPA: outer membrane beta-barrel protein [Burkholderiales bacterium]|nr:outer membrane beta-barrel protein [Burkholderiales bacterium]